MVNGRYGGVFKSSVLPKWLYSCDYLEFIVRQRRNAGAISGLLSTLRNLPLRSFITVVRMRRYLRPFLESFTFLPFTLWVDWLCGTYSSFTLPLSDKTPPPHTTNSHLLPSSLTLLASQGSSPAKAVHVLPCLTLPSCPHPCCDGPPSTAPRLPYVLHVHKSLKFFVLTPLCWIPHTAYLYHIKSLLYLPLVIWILLSYTAFISYPIYIYETYVSHLYIRGGVSIIVTPTPFTRFWEHQMFYLPMLYS